VVLTRGGSASRSTAVRYATWTPGQARGAWTAEIEGARAIVNLAGESIAARRWSPVQKQQILDSRVSATRTVADAIRAASKPPQALVSGSAVGYYGPLGDEIVTEEHPAGADFLAKVCQQWESEAIRSVEAGTRVACIRT